MTQHAEVQAASLDKRIRIFAWVSSMQVLKRVQSGASLRSGPRKSAYLRQRPMEARFNACLTCQPLTEATVRRVV